jgi:peptide/nickel transport system substrate-binding protein
MWRRARSLTMLMIVVTCTALAAGCGSDSSDGGSADAGGPKPVLRIGLSNAGSGGLDPRIDTTGPQTPMRMLAYEALINMKPDGSAAPGLATAWRFVGEGNKVFELTLRQDARFSDGTPVDAAAVKKWLEWYAKRGPFADKFGQLDTIELDGDRTLRIHLRNGNPNLPYILSDQYPVGSVLSPQALADERLGTATAGAGQYKLDPSQTVVNDHYTYVPNEHYYDQDAVKFSKVTVKIITNPASMLQAATTGQIDAADGDLSTIDSAKGAGLEVVSAPTFWTGLIILDRIGKQVPALADERVRQALNYAIDRRAITQALAGEYGEASSELLSTDGFDESYRDHYDYDPAKARQLLAEAGYADGFTMRVLAQVLALGEPVTRSVAKYLRDVGVNVEVDAPATAAEWLQKIVSGRYPVFQVEFESFPLAIPYGTLIAPPFAANPLQGRQPDVEALSARAATSSDPQSDYQEMSRLIN